MRGVGLRFRDRTPATLAVLSILALAWPGCSRQMTEDAPPRGIWFTDSTRASGIRFVHSHGGSGRHYYIEQLSGGGALFDYDSDGWLDIVLVQGAPLAGSPRRGSLTSALYHNNGNGTFGDVTRGSGLDVVRYGLGVAAGDYDNDGRQDLYVTSLGGNRLLHNEGGGRFRDVTKQTGTAGSDLSTSAAWLDYDADGHLDLFVARYMDYELETDPGCTDNRGQSIYCGPERFPPTSSLLFRNNGDGTFTDASRSSGIAGVAGRSLGVATADFDGDDRIDLFVANDQTPNVLFMNRGNGLFEETAVRSGVSHGDDGTTYAGMGADTADFTNDGWPDLSVTNYEDEPVSILTNEGHATFGNRSYASRVGNASRPYLKWGVQFLDVDLDAFLDLFVVNGHLDDRQDERGTGVGHAQPAQLFRNTTDGTFSDISASSGPAFATHQVGRGAAFGDVDNDGDVDALIIVNNGAAKLWRNDSDRHGNNWLRVSLVGHGCNRDGLGARVQVRSGPTTQTRYQRSGTSYLSDHDRRLTFGIGTAEQATVTVRWPCGAEQTTTVAKNSAIVVEETHCLLRPRP